MTDEEKIRRIATEVMDWTEKQMGPEWVWLTGGTYDRGDGYQIPCNINQRGPDAFNPLTNPAHWMLVVERMRELGWRGHVHSCKGYYLTQHKSEEVYRVCFNHSLEVREEEWQSDKSLGHAVCEAALKAVT